jgi:SAM-dependent methyltransferase
MSDEQTTSTRTPTEQMLQMITSYWLSQALGAAARLGIPDQIAREPKTSEQIAAAVGVNTDAAHRLLRALASVGVFRQLEGGRFGLTALGETLRENTLGSVRDFAIAETDGAHWQPWGKFVNAVKSGQPVSKAALGMELWEWYGEHPEDARSFSSAMGNLAQMVAIELVDLVDFSNVQRVIDVGGAHGVLLAAILHAHPSLSGILFDLPHVIAAARPVIEAEGLIDRCELISGDFFKEIPAGADVHLLKQIIHDWDDQRAIQILSNCRRALRPNGRVLLVEMVIPADNGPEWVQFIDLNMLTLLGGRERSEAEFAALFQKAGFRPPRFLPTPTAFVVIEARRAQVVPPVGDAGQ